MRRKASISVKTGFCMNKSIPILFDGCQTKAILKITFLACWETAEGLPFSKFSKFFLWKCIEVRSNFICHNCSTSIHSFHDYDAISGDFFQFF